MKNQNANRTIPLRKMVWAGLVTTAILGGIYLKAESHLRELTAALTQLEATSASSEQQGALLQHEVDAVAENTSAIVAGPTASPDEARRNTTLAVIARLKAAHEAHPPTPQKKAPPVPMGPGGIIFRELLSDPEYSAAYLVRIRADLRHFKLPELLRLGLSEELGEKVIAVLAERQLAFEDYQQLAGKDGAGIPGEIATPINEDTNNQLRQLMGDETYKRYTTLDKETMVVVPLANGNGRYGYGVPSHEALVESSRSSYIPLLTTRLSYSDSPLQPEQADQLAEQLATVASGPNSQLYKAMYSDAFIDQASKILTSPQLDALRQLQAENQAIAIRGKLPKSSELPRNRPILK